MATVQSDERQMLRPTRPAENASGVSRDLFMWRIGTEVEGDDEPRFGIGEMNSGEECRVLETGLGDVTSVLLSDLLFRRCPSDSKQNETFTHTRILSTCARILSTCSHSHLEKIPRLFRTPKRFFQDALYCTCTTEPTVHGNTLDQVHCKQRCNTLKFNFQDFPRPTSFSRTFQILEILEKYPELFEMLWNRISQHSSQSSSSSS